MRYRVTNGHYVESGISFKITDDWFRAGNAHRALKESWVGHTSFTEIPEYIEETVAPLIGGISSGLVLNSSLHLYRFLVQFVCFPSGSMYLFLYQLCHVTESMFPAKIATNIETNIFRRKLWGSNGFRHVRR